MSMRTAVAWYTAHSSFDTGVNENEIEEVVAIARHTPMFK